MPNRLRKWLNKRHLAKINKISQKILDEHGLEFWTSGTGQKLMVHKISKCMGTNCPIHNPSDHLMKDWPTHYRFDRRIMERICPHGIGHSDPDDIKIRIGKDPGIHGCDGCCSESENING